MIVVLKYPYFRDVSEPDIYETATVHTEVGRLNTLETESHTPVAVSYFVCSGLIVGKTFILF